MRGTILLPVFCLILTAGCGSTMPGAVTEHHQPFDYSRPPCKASLQAPKPDEADIRYLGSGGIYLGWRGNAIILGPFFTNPPLLANVFGNFHHDRARIAEHLRDVPPDTVRAILTGHSHYDHFGDVPVVATDHAPAAAIYTNATGLKMLNAYPSLLTRMHEVHANEPFPIKAANGAEIMRVRPVASDHAPQICRSRRWPCNISHCSGEVWTSGFESHPLRDFCGGETFAYVIDLLHPGGAVALRIYYNDSAPEAPLGIPSVGDVDVAILCVASFDHVHGYPEALLEKIHPRHVLLTHYEDFFSKTEDRWRFVTLFTDRKAQRFVERMEKIDDAITPEQPVCGAKNTGWTMPVPREQVRFRVTPPS